MNVRIVGTVAPPGGAPAQLLGNLAADFVANGDDVELISPDLRSASHRHARLSGLWLAIQLVRGARRFDAVVLRIEPNVPLRPGIGRFARAATLIGLGGALRLYKHVTLRLDSPVPLPGGLGGRSTRPLWARADAIVVRNEEDARNLCLVPGVKADRVTIEEPTVLSRDTHVDDWNFDPAGNVREDIMSLVRERARSDRKAMQAHSMIVGESGLSLDSAAFDDARAPAPSIIVFSRFGFARAKRLAKKLLAGESIRRK